MRLYGVEEMEGRAILRPVSSETLGTGERVGQFHPLPCSLREDNKVLVGISGTIFGTRMDTGDMVH